MSKVLGLYVYNVGSESSNMLFSDVSAASLLPDSARPGPFFIGRGRLQFSRERSLSLCSTSSDASQDQRKPCTCMYSTRSLLLGQSDQELLRIQLFAVRPLIKCLFEGS